MSTIPNGGPAFPVPAGNFSGGESWTPTADGMSLRDYFAAHALIPDKVLGSALDTSASEFEALHKLAKWAYLWADAMIAERDRQR